jgi:hypothetical protein
MPNFAYVILVTASIIGVAATYDWRRSAAPTK